MKDSNTFHALDSQEDPSVTAEVVQTAELRAQAVESTRLSIFPSSWWQ